MLQSARLRLSIRPVRCGLEFEAHMEIARLEAYKAAGEVTFGTALDPLRHAGVHG